MRLSSCEAISKTFLEEKNGMRERNRGLELGLVELYVIAKEYQSEPPTPPLPPVRSLQRAGRVIQPVLTQQQR
jgi:hypothetical protein